MPDEARPGEQPTTASEATPLLGGEAQQAQRAQQALRVEEEEALDGEKPLPKLQVALLCFARVMEPIAFFSVFPYINQMVQDNGGVADADVGFYSGLIESLFSLTQTAVMLGWGRAADRVGRKPVLVASLAGMAGATALFGLARTLPQMVALRCLAGVFAGTIVTIRTMLAEHSTPATQARIFSWFAVSGNLGIFLGPLLGGALADPLGQHDKKGKGPGAGGGDGSTVPFLATFPYALPGFVVAALGLVAAAACAWRVEETLVRAPPAAPAGFVGGDGIAVDAVDAVEAALDGQRHDAADTGHVPAALPRLPEPTSIRQLLAAPGVGIVLYVYAHVMLLAFAYTAVAPVFWFTPVALGGLGRTPLQISLLMGVSGAGQALWLLLAFPPLQRRLGTNGVMRACAAAYPAFFAASPLAGLLLRLWPVGGGGGGGGSWGGASARDVVFWALVPPLLAVGSGVSMCFTAVQLAVNDVAPAPQTLGTLNALALTGVSAIRAVAPALFTSLFALGVRAQWLGGYAIWLLLALLALGYTAAARHLPDYEALKKKRRPT